MTQEPMRSQEISALNLESYPVRQAPRYPDRENLQHAQMTLYRQPALARPEHVAGLAARLAHIHRHKGFAVHAGDCAESFSPPPDYANVTWKLFRTVHALMRQSLGDNTAVIGRVAGQYAKPRSKLFETVDGLEVPSYHGDIVNGFSVHLRSPDPWRMLIAYEHSANLLAHLGRLSERCDSKFGEHIFTGHEAYLLPYEEAMIRSHKGCDVAGLPAGYYGGSAHFLWVGERTRNLDGAHIAFARSVVNPIGVKISGTLEPVEASALIRLLNPEERHGRLSLICRFGAGNIESCLPKLLEHLKDSPVMWVCDPMHGNTRMTDSGLKTRDYDTVEGETRLFFDILRSYGVHPSGLHCEASGYPVTECHDPAHGLEEDTLKDFYTTTCDPRLNYDQILRLAAYCGQRLRFCAPN